MKILLHVITMLPPLLPLLWRTLCSRVAPLINFNLTWPSFVHGSEVSATETSTTVIEAQGPSLDLMYRNLSVCPAGRHYRKVATVKLLNLHCVDRHSQWTRIQWAQPLSNIDFLSENFFSFMNQILFCFHRWRNLIQCKILCPDFKSHLPLS